MCTVYRIRWISCAPPEANLSDSDGYFPVPYGSLSTAEQNGYSPSGEIQSVSQ